MSTDLFGLLSAQDEIVPAAGTGQLVLAAVIGIALIVGLIVWLDVHPFLALTLGSLAVGAVATMPMVDVLASFTLGVGATVSGVGVLIALGAMFGKLLADSGGADEIVDTIVGRASTRMLPWAMAVIGALIGLPMFFEIGLVLLMPVIYLVARRSGQSLITIGLPTLAGLSAMHGFVPPHPGPLVAIDSLGADVGVTLALGIVVAIPTVVIAGPLFTKVAERWVYVGPEHSPFEAIRDTRHRRPSFGVTVFTVLLPVVLMMARALVELWVDEDLLVYKVLDFLGTPLIALLIAVLVAIFTLGVASGMDKKDVNRTVSESLPPIAGILLIVGAGGGFKQVLVDSGIGQVIADFVTESGLSVLVVAWLVAVLIRLATGSATVATVTAAGIIAPLVTGMDTTEVSLVVLAIGAGSVFFSHVNDAGFWLIKEYFGMTVGQTIRTWSLMETVLSVSGLVFVLLLNLVV
jgi:GntP family gluconate:H+ symporter